METVSTQLPPRSAVEFRPRGRSAVSNGSRLHVVKNIDGAWARRFRDVLAQIIDDLMASNKGGLSEGQRQLARRAATIAIGCERMEAEAAAGKDFDMITYGVLSDRLGRVFQRLGLKRNAVDEQGGWRSAYAEEQRLARAGNK